MKTLIAATLLLVSTSAFAAPKGHWYLFLDTWTCHTKGCDLSGPAVEDQGDGETFDTQKQCLAKGRRLAPNKYVDLYDFTITVGKVVPNCVWYRSPQH